MQSFQMNCDVTRMRQWSWKVTIYTLHAASTCMDLLTTGSRTSSRIGTDRRWVGGGGKLDPHMMRRFHNGQGRPMF